MSLTGIPTAAIRNLLTRALAHEARAEQSEAERKQYTQHIAKMRAELQRRGEAV